MSENMNYIQNRKYRPVCTIIIVILNILAFAILEFMGDTEDVGFMVKYGAMYTPYLLERGEVYRLFSCIFLHFGIAHLLNNMICLVSFGYVIEKNLGLIRFLILLLELEATCCQCIWNWFREAILYPLELQELLWVWRELCFYVS